MPAGLRLICAALAALAVAACGRAVDDRRLVHASESRDDWLTSGRTYAESRDSPLSQINRDDVDRIGLAWEASLESHDFGVEATPIEADGVLYVTSTWSRVFAFDARTGRRLWAFDPQVKHEWLRQGCCKAVNRGVALWKGKVYVAAFDGRLFALDARSGKPVWSVDTTAGQRTYSITGAPRIANGKVVIGNGGADFGARGYLSAYDAASGRLAWRFHVMPPGQGGGGPWDAIAYDPQLNLVYVGTGNAGPAERSGDNLYACSILALDANTGRLKWAYQTTPGDRWDFDAVQNLILADLPLAGRSRKVLMQASKNGFFYVLDRATGQLISAQAYVRVTWADHVDLKTGRPVMKAAADYRAHGRALLFPSPYGGHNWQPMAMSRRTGLVYVPAQDMGWVWDPKGGAWFYRSVDGGSLAPQEVTGGARGQLIAWDPKAGRAAWRVTQPEPMNGGVLVTAGGLVIQGTADGFVDFRDEANGKLLRRIAVGTGISAPPIAYRVGGTEYVALAAGWNGVRLDPDPPGAPAPFDNAGRLIVLKLDGGPVRVAPRAPDPLPFMSGPAPAAVQVAKGRALYTSTCARCHGFAGERTPFPDLRRMAGETEARFDDIVLKGAYRDGGMASFSDVLTPSDTAAIRAYLHDWARRSAAASSLRPGG